MWYLFACVATPLSVSCIPPLEVDAQRKCEELAARWRGTALVSHEKSNPRTQCVYVEDVKQGQAPSGALEIPLIKPNF